MKQLSRQCSLIEHGCLAESQELARNLESYCALPNFTWVKTEREPKLMTPGPAAFFHTSTCKHGSESIQNIY